MKYFTEFKTKFRANFGIASSYHLSSFMSGAKHIIGVCRPYLEIILVYDEIEDAFQYLELGVEEFYLSINLFVFLRSDSATL